MEVAYVPGVGVVDRDEGLKVAARWLLERAKEAGRDPIVIVPVKNSVRNSPVLEALKGAGVQIETHRTFRGSVRGRPVLAVWPDEKTLHEVTRGGAPHAICVVLWTEVEAVLSWLRAQSATDLTGASGSLSAPGIADPVVEAALRTLSATVNLSTGLGHPSDRSGAVHLFRELRRNGHQFDANEVYQWAIAHGWTGGGARQIREVAQGVNDGRQFRVATTSPWRTDIIQRWRAEAAKPRSASE